MPAPVYPLDRDWYAYKADDGNTYQIATTTENGTTINAGTPVPVGTNPTLPRGWKARHIYGVYDDTGVLYRTKVPILEPTNALWVGTTTTFAKGGQTFDIQGRAGEDRFDKGG